MTEREEGIRVDRWLWAARFFKTRSLAKTAVEGGKVHVDGQRIKPAKDLRVGQSVKISRGTSETTVVVTQLSQQRGPAPVAQQLYNETQESIEQRELMTSRRRMERAGLQVPSTRPSKKERRDLRKFKDLNDPNDDSNDRWQEPS